MLVCFSVGEKYLCGSPCELVVVYAYSTLFTRVLVPEYYCNSPRPLPVSTTVELLLQ